MRTEIIYNKEVIETNLPELIAYKYLNSELFSIISEDRTNVQGSDVDTIVYNQYQISNVKMILVDQNGSMVPILRVRCYSKNPMDDPNIVSPYN